MSRSEWTFRVSLIVSVIVLFCSFAAGQQDDWNTRFEARARELVNKNGPGTDPQLKQELLKMNEEDQGIRTRLTSSPEEQRPALLQQMEHIDSRLTARLKDIVAQKGWPTIALVGIQASQAAAVILIHSADHDWQAAMLPQLRDLVKQDKIVGSDIALVIDKLCVARGEPQEFGTQFKSAEGKVIMLPVRDAEKLEERRAQYLLPPMSVYRKMLADTYHLTVE